MRAPSSEASQAVTGFCGGGFLIRGQLLTGHRHVLTELTEMTQSLVLSFVSFLSAPQAWVNGILRARPAARTGPVGRLVLADVAVLIED
jgi:hypothetical protein